MSASLAVQKALFTALEAALSGQVSGVFDGVPADAALPYATIGPDLTTDWSHKTGSGREHRISVSVWDAGPGVAAAKALLGRAEAAVLALGGDIGGHRIAGVTFVRGFVSREPGGESRGLAEFRIRTEAI